MLILESKSQFCKGVLKAIKKEISQIPQIHSTDATGSYLGCMNIDQKRKTQQDSDEIKRRIHQKLANSKARILSATSNVVLIKPNLTSILQF